VHEVARRNGKTSNLTIDDLRACDNLDGGRAMETNAAAAIKRKMQQLNFNHISALFSSRRLAFSTSMIMAVWAFIGLAFPLYVSSHPGLKIDPQNAFIPYTLAIRGAEFEDGSTYITYRNSCIIAVLGVPGAILGGVLTELKWFGRKGTLSLATILTGVFIYGSTTAKSSNTLLAWNCVYSFFSNVMYAVLYAYTPEIFPTKHRGTGNALTATANRVFGIMGEYRGSERR
jgi:MFS family permease